MAGPFSLPPNSAQEIAPVRLAGGVSVPEVENNPLGIVNKALEAGVQYGKLNQQRLLSQATSGVQKEVQSVKDALKLTQRPDQISTYFSESARKDPYIDSVYKEYQRIQNAVQDGRFSQEYAIERIQEVVDTATSKRPQFINEIKTAANQALGSNLSSQIYQQLFSRSPEQVAQEATRREAASLGLPVNDYMAISQKSFRTKAELQELQLRKAQGENTVNDLASEVRLHTVEEAQSLTTDILTQISSGGVTNPEVLKAGITSRFEARRNQLTASLPKGADPSAVNAQLNLFDEWEARLIRMVDNGSALKIAQNQNNLSVEIAKSDARDGLGSAYKMLDILGPEQGLQALNVWTQFKSDPTKYAGMLRSSDTGGTITLGLFLDQAYAAALVTKGQREASTQQERILAGYISALGLKGNQGVNPDGTQKQPMPPQEAQRLVDVVVGMGEEYSTTTLADSKVAATVAQYKETYPAVIRHFESDRAALQREYDRLKSQGMISDGQLQLVGPLNGPSMIEIGGRTGLRAASLAQYPGNNQNYLLEDFVRKANTVLKLGRTYGSNGVLPKTVWSNGNQFLRDIEAPAPLAEDGTQAPPSTQPEVIDATRNPDGTWNFGGGN